MPAKQILIPGAALKAELPGDRMGSSSYLS
jgi:hypothetical protein